MSYMRKIVCWILLFAMILLNVFGCNNGLNNSDEETDEMEKIEESEEICLILEQEWVPEDIKSDLDSPITWKQMLGMLTNIIAECDAESVDDWTELYVENDSVMQRDDGMLAIYEAACVLGIGNRARGNALSLNAYYNNHGIWENGFDVSDTVFSNIWETCPYEPNPGWKPEWDYIAGASLYSLGHSSAANEEPFFEVADTNTDFSKSLSRREAISAVAKLLQAYEVHHIGSYILSETEWNHELLEDAKSKLDEIISSSTSIEKSDEFVLGETYTGNAYYVSNAGSDENDGLSVENAWKTLEKVQNEKLNYGDVVFFEHGGIWQGRLVMQHGVTYSAYGEGEKPIITGSPLDAAQPEKWILYSETENGGKIWKYVDDVEDCGIILLDGKTIARKAYPAWDGTEYVNSLGEKFDIMKDLYDLMYFSAVDMSGIGFPAQVESNGNKGPLYLRCDEGNPGEVFNKIEMSIISKGTTTADEGMNAIDNIHFCFYSVSGMDCNCHNDIVYQNCEVEFCGGGIKTYDESMFGTGKPAVNVSGGGLLLFGSNLIARNNYIHDCENKGIAIVINGRDGDNHVSSNRKNILAEGNVVERCGSSVYMWVGNMGENDMWKYEDICFRNNYFVNGGYGWRQRNMLDLEEDTVNLIFINDVSPTGEIVFENNLFYRVAGNLINWYGQDIQSGEDFPTFKGNTYVQDKGQMLFTKQDNIVDYYPECTLATSNIELAEKAIHEYIGDSTGKVIIFE